MSDFMQRQFDISQQLIRMMYKDAEERMTLLNQISDLVAEKDRKIAKLQSTIDALNAMQGVGNAD